MKKNRREEIYFIGMYLRTIKLRLPLSLFGRRQAREFCQPPTTEIIVTEFRRYSTANFTRRFTDSLVLLHRSQNDGTYCRYTNRFLVNVEINSQMLL